MIWLVIALMFSCGLEQSRVEYEKIDASPVATPGSQPQAPTEPPASRGGSSIPVPGPSDPIDIGDKPSPEEPDPIPEPVPEPIEPDPTPDPFPPELPDDIPALSDTDFYCKGSGATTRRWPYCSSLPRDYWVLTHHRWWSHVVGQEEFCRFYSQDIEYGKCNCRMR